MTTLTTTADESVMDLLQRMHPNGYRVPDDAPEEVKRAHSPEAQKRYRRELQINPAAEFTDSGEVAQ